MFANILGGLCFVAGGLALCYYSAWIVREFGRNARAELHLGGTRNLLILIGFAIVVIGLLLMFGALSMQNPTDQIPTGVVM